MVDGVAVAAFVDTGLVEEELFETGLVELLAGLLDDETFEEDFELTFDELLETLAEVFKVDEVALVDVLTVAVLALLLL
jgi:hypothetical protein